MYFYKRERNRYPDRGARRRLRTLTAFKGGHVPDLAPGATPARFVSAARTDDDRLSDAAHGKPEHRWRILAVLATAQLMVALDATVVSIALAHANHQHRPQIDP
jgi:hypothetical protein